MKLKILLLLFCLTAVAVDGFSQRKVIKAAKKGSVTPANYCEKVPFRYVDKHIFIDVVINGVIHNFIFDTGASFNVVDLNQIENLAYKKVKKLKISGSSFGKHKTQLIEVESLSISNMKFTQFGAFVMDLSFIDDFYPCSTEKPISGIIGASLMRKMNFQIDYVHQVITMADDFSKLHIPDESPRFEMTSKNLAIPIVTLNLNGIDKKFLIDTGSNGKITTGIEFQNELVKTTNEVKIVSLKREDESNVEYVNFYANIKQMNVCGIELQNQILTLQKGTSSLIGNQFLENFKVSFDWTNNMLILEGIKKPIQMQLIDFEFRLDLNNETKKIEIMGIYNPEKQAVNYEIGTAILKIDSIDISDFSFEELCSFWENDWTQIKRKENVVIETVDHKIELHKTNYFE